MLTTFLLLGSLGLFGFVWLDIVRSGIGNGRHKSGGRQPYLELRDPAEFQQRYGDKLPF
jgi:hypothetical protein